MCGLASIASGCLSGPPILISPESAAGIKAGAKTGLSTLVCGILFGISAFFSPLFASVPAAGTAPLLLIVGVLLFQNTKRIDWTNIGKALPSYCCLFFIPFTYSILRGVAFGYVSYIIIGMFTGDFWVDSAQFLTDYLAPVKKTDKNEDETDPLTSGSGNAGGGGGFSVMNIMDKIMTMDMTHTDDNVVPISQDYDAPHPAVRSVGVVEDTLMADQNIAREMARQKMLDASNAFQRLMAENPMSLRRSASVKGRSDRIPSVDI